MSLTRWGGDDHDAYLDMRAEAEELRRDETAWPEGHERCAVVDEFDDQDGFEEQARPVRVTVLDCGHELVREGSW